MFKKKGFTLIELMIVMAVIGILATIALVGLGQAQKSARDVKRQATMGGIRTALECYYGVMGTYPGSVNWGNLTNSLNPTSPATTCIAVATVTDPSAPSTASSGNNGTWTVNTTPVVRYVYSGGGGSTYTLNLTGESKTVTWTNPN